MKSIYASKLFIASKRKEQIKAALLSTANQGLVQQLAEDLDEEYQTLENLGSEQQSSPEENKSEDDELNELIVDDEIDPENDLVTMDDLGKSSGSSSHSSAPKPSSHKSADKPEGEAKPEKSKADTSDLMPESPANEKPAEPEASTQVDNKSEVKAATLSDLNVLKGTLNSRQETAGVIRIAEKENEIWIYYNDDINLNDVMVEVIESITSLDIQSLEFNRLARSDNAIVFVTDVKSTAVGPESVDPEESKKEAEESLLNT